jgi:hypothetical protein
MLLGLREQYEEAATEEQPGVQWLIDRLSDYRQQRQLALETYFKKLDEAALRRRVESCIQKGATHHGEG